MTIEFVAAPPVAPPALHPLLARLMDLNGAPSLDATTFDAWAAQPGHALVVFTEDPVMHRETLDLAVIVPELAAALPGRFRTALLLQTPAREIARRYGFKRWPAVVLLRDGQYVGAIDGLREWQEYVDELTRLLGAEPCRPPTIGIPVAAAGDAEHCHH
jgi:hydrogenase-1 operon protein HyaE